MGHKLSASEEVQQLRQATREAHEAAQALIQAIKEARQLEPGLCARFEQHVQVEMESLSAQTLALVKNNYERLNEHITQARDEIWHMLSISQLEILPDQDALRIVWDENLYDTEHPIPLPENHRKGPTT